MVCLDTHVLIWGLHRKLASGEIAIEEIPEIDDQGTLFE